MQIKNKIKNLIIFILYIPAFALNLYAEEFNITAEEVLIDKDNETKIGEQIQHLPMTRIMIAHRQETINMAEQVYHLDNGVLTNLNDICSKAAS